MTLSATRTVRELHDGWVLSAAAGPVPASMSAMDAVAATVPGCVHTDLLAAGLIPDPYLDDHESELAWIGLVDWTYRTVFTWAPDGADRHDLVFDGLDTVARIELNGALVGETANQHRSYRFDVGALLADGDNELVVRFRSPIRYANEQSLALGPRERPYPLPYEAIRKSACNFGWDWGIATYTSGIWRPVRLESWSTARLAEVRLHASVGPVPRVDAVVSLELAGAAASAPLELEIEVAGQVARASVPAGEGTVRLGVEVPDAELWWPIGYGGQPLYEVWVRLVDAGAEPGAAGAPGAGAPASGAGAPASGAGAALPYVGRSGEPAASRTPEAASRAIPPTYRSGDAPASGAALDETTRRVGFRTVDWDTEPDEAGTPFTLVVNGQPVFVKGVNWIPDDALPVRADRARIERRLRQATDAGLNLIRVWGGGIYESDDFYELCDELGLLSWQDFLFACAAYPEEEPLFSEVAAEARENIVRLAPHASLVLLTGNNENLWGFEDWGWKERLDGKSWGARYYYELLPALVAELAPHVPYAPGSPFSPGPRPGEPGGRHPNDEDHGTTHLWEQWNRQDWTTYLEHRPRFVAEFGWQGPPTWTTLTRAISDHPLTPESPGMIVHQKAEHGNTKLTSGLVPHFRVPADMETWHWAMQLNQALAVRTALEHFRSWAPHTMGAIVWQLNDCWPVTSWAAIDGDERPKPLYYGIRQAFAPRVVTVQPRGDGLAAVLGNDTGEAWEGELRLARIGFDGRELASASIDARVDARGTATVEVPASVAVPGDPAGELIVASLGDARGFRFFAEPRDSRLPAASVELAARPHERGTLVTVAAGTLVRELTLLVDKVDPAAVARDALLTLLPGETASIIVEHEGPAMDAAALSDPRVLRTANELVTP